MRKYLVLLALVVVSTTLGTTPVAAYQGAPYFEPNKPYAQNFPDPSVVWDALDRPLLRIRHDDRRCERARDVVDRSRHVDRRAQQRFDQREWPTP
jgi:hypothetical protein